MGKDWEAVAAAINARLSELDMTQRELAERSGVSTATLRQLQNNYGPRRRSPRLLAAISETLHWPAGHLAAVLEGSGEATTDVRSLRADVDDLRRALDDLGSRVAALEAASPTNGTKTDHR